MQLSVREDSGGDSGRQFEEQLFDVLSNERRRFAVYAMSGREEIDLGKLARTIAAWETEKPESQVSSAERKRVYTALQQSHLPRLAEAGLIEYDDRASVIHPQPSLEECEVYMEVVSGREIPWNEYYLGLSAVAVALLSAVWIGAFPFSMLSDFAWLASVVAALTVSAVGHTYTARKARLSGAGTPPEVEIEEQEA